MVRARVAVSRAARVGRVAVSGPPAPVPDGLLGGRCGLVVGAEQPIGGQIARALARAGADIGLAATRADESVMVVRRLQREVQAEGCRAATYVMDTTLGQNVRVTTRQVAKELGGRLHYIVSASSAPWAATLARTGEAELDRVLRQNLLAHAYVARAALDELRRAGGGHLLVAVHAVGEAGGAGHAAFAMAQGGALALVRALAGEVEPGIAVSALVWGDPYDVAAPPPAAAGAHAVALLAQAPAEVNDRVVHVPQQAT